MRFNEFVDRRDADLLLERCARLLAEGERDPEAWIVDFCEEQESSFLKDATGLLSKGVDFVGGLFADKYQKALKALKNLQQVVDANERSGQLVSANDRNKNVKDWLGAMVKQLEAEKGLAELAGGKTGGEEKQPNANTQPNQPAANNAPATSQQVPRNNTANSRRTAHPVVKGGIQPHLMRSRGNVAQTAPVQNSTSGTQVVSAGNNSGYGGTWTT